MVTTIRAPLFVPASRPDRFAKAAASGADAIILDLEDAVALADKASARANLDSTFTRLPVIVRINAVGTPWFEEDLEAVKSQGFAAVMLPKSESQDDIAQLSQHLPQMTIIPLIETAKGLGSVRAIACAPNVTRLAFGSVDFCSDLGCEHLAQVLLPARSEIVLASRIAEIAAPLDGVTVEINDPTVVGADAAHARAIGMTGKMCIHPRQVQQVKHAFLPSDSEVAWARRVLEVSDGAASVDGKMVDVPVALRAEALLSRHRRILDKTKLVTSA